MARPKRRSWVDLSGEERRRRIMVIAGVSAALLLFGALLFSLGGGDGEAQAAEVHPSPTVRGDVTAWFESTALIRGEVMAAATAVRTFAGANDGLALQPACTNLGTQAAAAEAHPDAPDAALQALWAEGTTKFAAAADWCAKLWDGTPMAPPAILTEVTSALDAAEASWEELAKLAGQPLPALPSGTFAPLDGRRVPSSPRPASTPTAPAATATATAAPTPVPDSTPPSITLPTFDQPSPTVAATDGVTGAVPAG